MEENIRLGKQILHEDDLKITATYEGEMFVLKYPDPIQQSQIEMEIARRLGGYPRSSYSADYLMQLEMNVIVDMLYIAESCPAWYEGPFRDYDEQRTIALYNAYLKFRDKFRRRLHSGKSKTGNKGGGA